MPWIEISEEEYERRERQRILGLILDAQERGDEEEERRLTKQFAPTAEVLMSAKRVIGADWLRKVGYDMRHAEKEYGPDWLDR